jgi:hypothetical protein
VTALPGTPPPAGGPVYPLPATAEDPRFTVGLLLAVADVLTAHGYPPPQAGADLVRFQQALFTALYQPRPDQPDRAETP